MAEKSSLARLKDMLTAKQWAMLSRADKTKIRLMSKQGKMISIILDAGVVGVFYEGKV